MPPKLSQVVGAFRERMPTSVLHHHVDRIWINALHGPTVIDVVPDGCIDIYWTGSTLQIAGPNTETVSITMPGAVEFVGVRFNPGIAGRWLGVTAREILNRHVPLADFWRCADVSRMTQGLAEAGSAVSVAALLEQFLVERLPHVAPADPIAAATVSALRRAGRETRGIVGQLKAEFGWSERTLRRHCHAAYGYGPKTLERILRFQGFLRRLPGGRTPLAVLALEAGYADQAHLTREVRRLSGQSPSSLVSALSPEGHVDDTRQHAGHRDLDPSAMPRCSIRARRSGP